MAQELENLLVGKLKQILHLRALPSDTPVPSDPKPLRSFEGVSPKEILGYKRIFGGQLMGQALMAATRTVDNPSLLVHSFHCYFLRPGDTSAPVVYHVERIRDGAAFSARRVKGYQGTREIFLLTASFHKPEEGLAFQVDPRPGVPRPQELLMVEEEEWRMRTTPVLPMAMRRRLARRPVLPMPVELRHCESVERLAVCQLLSNRQAPRDGPSGSSSSRTDGPTNGPRTKQRHDLNVWIRARGVGAGSSDLRLHRCIIAYFSDFVLLGTTLTPHGLFPVNPRRFDMASLDHAMWFHEKCLANEWLLYSLRTPWTGHARGLSLGRLYTEGGLLVASTAQEGLIRPLHSVPATPPPPAAHSPGIAKL